MANKKISELDDGNVPAVGDKLVIARGGSNYQIDAATIATATALNAVSLVANAASMAATNAQTTADSAYTAAASAAKVGTIAQRRARFFDDFYQNGLVAVTTSQSRVGALFSSYMAGANPGFIESLVNNARTIVTIRGITDSNLTGASTTGITTTVSFLDTTNPIVLRGSIKFFGNSTPPSVGFFGFGSYFTPAYLADGTANVVAGFRAGVTGTTWQAYVRTTNGSEVAVDTTVSYSSGQDFQEMVVIVDSSRKVYTFLINGVQKAQINLSELWGDSNFSIIASVSRSSSSLASSTMAIDYIEYISDPAFWTVEQFDYPVTAAVSDVSVGGGSV
jgi:hypothetical protein